MEEITKNFATMPLRFRVWDKEKGQFLTMSYAYSLIQLSDTDKNNIEFDLPSFVALMDNYAYYDDWEQYIISQDTGLKDKNGKNIYTGDIITTPDYIIEPDFMVVKYNIEHGCSRIYPFYPESDDDVAPDAEEVEVVDNIWQNPELLKGEK